ncbi:MAG: hypothetical protein E6G39_10380 [Actinobacteria bacterium]|nr:MAG: hypothetical protein E6G39_10380 [Actinomycetota bacterium]
MDEFDDRARRAGAALNQSVIDLVPTAAPAPSKSTRRVGIAVALAGVLTAGGFIIANRDHGGDRQVLAQLPSTTIPESGSAPAHYLPRWLPDGFQRGPAGAGIGTFCLTFAPAPTDAATPVPAVPPPVTNADGCPADAWTAVFSARAFGGAPIFIVLRGGFFTPPQQAETVSVHGRPASLLNQGGSWWLSWAEPDLNLTLTGLGVSRYDLLRVAESVERVDDNEWNQAAPPR